MDLVLSDHFAVDGWRTLTDVWLPSAKLSSQVADWEVWAPAYICSVGHGAWRIEGWYGRPWIAECWIADMLNGGVLPEKAMRPEQAPGRSYCLVD